MGVMEGQLDPKPDFVDERVVVCGAMDPVKDVKLHFECGEADWTNAKGRKAIRALLEFSDSFYPEIHRNVRRLLVPEGSDTATTSIKRPRFDFILADFPEIAVADLAMELGYPYAMVAQQLSFPRGRASFIPGLPGLPNRIISTEHATLAERVSETWFAVVFLLSMIPWIKAHKANRREVYSGGKPPPTDSEHLRLINCFWGFEIPRSETPNSCMIGPLLAESWDPLTPDLELFLEKRTCVVYVAFGTHATLTAERFGKMYAALQTLLRRGTIDGVVWSIKKIPEGVSIERNDSIMMLSWVAQRAILDHKVVRLFFCHAGGGSVNEGLYHGVPMLCMPIHGDQYASDLRLRAVGVGQGLHKHHFTVAEAVDKATQLIHDGSADSGMVALNCRRMKGIANAAAGVGKLVAAARIEESIADHEMYYHQPSGTARRPRYLQTPAARMSFWKQKNVDLYTLGLFVAVYKGCAHVAKGAMAAVLGDRESRPSRDSDVKSGPI